MTDEDDRRMIYFIPAILRGYNHSTMGYGISQIHTQFSLQAQQSASVNTHPYYILE